MVGHGFGNLYGWLNGVGPEKTAAIFEQHGFVPGALFTVVAGVTELAAGALFTVGLLTPVGAAGIIGLMVTAILTVHAGNGPWYTNRGWEYNLTLVVAAAAVAITGAGSVSADAALGIDLSGYRWGTAAVGLGVLAAVATLALRRRPQPAGPPDPTGGDR